MIRSCHLTGGVAMVLLLLGGTLARADGSGPYAVGVSNFRGETDWSGFYLGGQLGGAWSTIDWSQRVANYFNTLGPTVVGTNSGFDASGVEGGILGGYNYQMDHWVVGLELAATATDLSQSRISPFFPALDRFSTEVNWLATVAGRVGYACDRWLVYGRGGWTGGDVELTLRDVPNGVTASKDTWANGWTIGAGSEYMISPGIALGLAYDYVALNLDGETITCPACGTGRGAGFGAPILDADYKIQTVSARLSFFIPDHP
jgi:outer membrane immunogenic protein